MFRRGLTLAAAATAFFLSACTAGAPSTGSSGTLTFSGPTEQAIKMGEVVPGASIRYTGYSDQGAQVLINDQPAVKKVGDSLDWNGTPFPGTSVSMNQRILLANESRLQTVGTVKVTVQNVRPEVALFPGQAQYSYKVAMTYTVRKGETIPGTLIGYKGKSEAGAEFSGVNGYPYRKMGDSVVWTGRLTPNAYLEATFRVIAYTDDFVTLAALATVALA